MINREELERLHEAATKGDLTTAERHTEREWVECPFCGDGEIEATDYCNFDGVALGVQFYGIGKEFGAHEALWSYLRNAVPDILNLLASVEQADKIIQDIVEERNTLAAENAALTAKVERLLSTGGKVAGQIRVMMRDDDAPVSSYEWLMASEKFLDEWDAALAAYRGK